MRVGSLAITAFGPFKHRQEIDFARFRDDGLFLITGRTGAGKSSILDAICFALYGSVPRYDGSEPRLRSDHASPDEPTSVELEFSVNHVDYRVVRGPAYDRPKRTGTGTTQQKATAELFMRGEQGWEGISARPVDVARDIERIVGLTRDQFLQVILLAQNRFQEFLLAKNEDRQRVLRSLFATHRFLDFETTLGARRAALDAELAAARATIDRLAAKADTLCAVEPNEPDGGAVAAAGVSRDLASFETALLALVDSAEHAQSAVEFADAAVRVADDEHRALEATQRAQERRASAEAELHRLSGAAPAIDANRHRVRAAHRAAAVLPYVLAAADAEQERELVAADLAAARAAFEDVVDRPARPDAIDDPMEVRRSVDEITRQLGSIEAAIHDEKALPELDAEIDRLHARLREASDAEAAANLRGGALPAEIETVGMHLGDALARAGTVDEAAVVVDRLATALTAARDATEVGAQLTAALEAESVAAAADARAGEHVSELLVLRLSGYAGELAAELRHGEPCAVCGGVEHPAPATTTSAPVTADDVASARTRSAAARVVSEKAHAATVRLERLLGDLRAASGGRSVDDLDEDLAGARRRHSDGVAAAASATALAAEQTRLRAELDSVAETIAQARSVHAAAAASAADIAARRETLSERVASARGTHRTVADRSTHLATALRAAGTLASCLTRMTAAGERVDLTAASLSERISAQGFENAGAVRAASLEPSDIESLDATIATHDQAVAAAAAVMAELAIAHLPSEPVSLAETRSNLTAALALRDTAVSANDSLTDRVRRLTAVVHEARDILVDFETMLERHGRLRELAATIEGKDPNEKRMRLETYVLAAKLEEIVVAANARLGIMTSGRFSLEHDDSVQYRNTQSGLGLVIRDEHSGRARATHSLSGGETFLASLALALGLAEVVTGQAGGIRLDTLFVDEGFGSLDSETLGIAMGTLDSLRAGGRTIGLISHVEAMKEQIPTHLRISVDPNGWSHVEEEPALVG